MPKDKLIFSLEENMTENTEEFLEFYDKNLNMYHSTVPLAIVYQDSFYVKYLGDLYFILNNEPLIPDNDTEEFRSTLSPVSLEAVCR